MEANKSNNSFDFDDSEFGDFGSDLDDLFGSQDTSSDDNDLEEQSTVSSNDEFDTTLSDQIPGGNIKKTAIFTIICGIILIVVIFIVVNLLSNASDKPSSYNNSINTESEHSESSEYNSNNQSVSQDTSSNSGWTAFEDTNSEITFNEDYIDSIFTVTSHKNYVKIVDNKNNILVKTVLIGALSGYTGTYEIEVPYSMGSLVADGMSFEVKVQIGVTNSGQRVVGDIKYE